MCVIVHDNDLVNDAVAMKCFSTALLTTEFECVSQTELWMGGMCEDNFIVMVNLLEYF
jgi:hypothetical protein